MSDAFKLDRFIDAQEPTYPNALGEIRAGKKRSHWMWFIFPQIAGLGFSEMAQRFAISSIDEARAYLAHPVLGYRLSECVNALQDLPTADATVVFGLTDATKLRSSLTLFSAAGGPSIIDAAMSRWFRGERDNATLEILARQR
jgi:uncharacterized protein (DUF1810 family)